MRRPGMVSHSESSLNAISWMSPPHLGHLSGNSSPTRAMSLALLIRVAAAFLGMPTGHSFAPLADVGGGSGVEQANEGGFGSFHHFWTLRNGLCRVFPMTFTNPEVRCGVRNPPPVHAEPRSWTRL